MGFPDEVTLMFLGDSSSVRKRSSGAVDERNSDTVPVRETRSPGETEARIEVEVVNTFKPYEARISDDGFPLR